MPFLCTTIVFVSIIYFAIKLEGTALRYPSAGTLIWINSVFFQWPGVRCLEE